jgi:hypothetical protein
MIDYRLKAFYTINLYPNSDARFNGNTNPNQVNYIFTNIVYFGGSPKYVSKWISTDEEEINAVNEGWILVREEKRIIAIFTRSKSVQRQL